MFGFHERRSSYIASLLLKLYFSVDFRSYYSALIHRVVNDCTVVHKTCLLTLKLLFGRSKTHTMKKSNNSLFCSISTYLRVVVFPKKYVILI